MQIDHETNLIIDAIEEFGGTARLVGGCVRDAILNRDVHDIDLATNLLPEQVIKALKLHNIKTIPTGLKHGTITAILNQRSFEITTLRHDTQCDGRHAKVEFTDDWRMDASRRDFTFNALYADKHGHIYDYFDGIKDLKARRLNFIGNAEDRIKEDYLRILRAFRFHAKICIGDLSSEVLEVCKKHSHKIFNLSGERIRDEIFKLLECDNPVSTLKSMQKSEVLQKIIPQEVKCEILSSDIFAGAGQSSVIPARNAGLSFSLDLSVSYSDDTKQTDPLVKLALLLRTTDIAEPSVIPVPSVILVAFPSVIPARDTGIQENLGKYICKFLRLSNKQSKKLLFLLSNNIPIELSESEQKKYISLYGAEFYCDLVKICGAESGENVDVINQYISFASTFNIPKFPLSGDDLINIGYQPGKNLGRSLELIKQHWENSSYTLTKDELMLYAKKLTNSAY
ncbi:CCA tRNA nucleotidyltransferase [Wolbachia endosymbiont of Folsomia candida]|uniref:CCA tRNA nucleotidyltransferase n=1 Tax=Wolbachia endosymbiont of Folsomia candida TaxID=169402 RepID=UPI000AFF9EF1|nr:CCA tRNA nucleotidyltransferase [Wolbachia endosymbiont of Folsomia candida]APR98808.1 CCA tRNA nucleotidyltransferase [Wolbachia endosymbiont of Folsomia candida]